MKTKPALWDDPVRIAHVMFAANAVMGFFGLFATLYALLLILYAPVFFLIVIPIPITGYWLLWEYGKRENNPLYPRIAPWVGTILYNALLPFLTLVITDGEWTGLGLLAVVWNIIMILGAARALVLDMDVIHENQTREQGEGRAA